MEKYTPNYKKKFNDKIIPALMKKFDYKSNMQVPKLEKIVLNQGLGKALTDKKVIDMAMQEMGLITGQKPVTTISKKDISNFKLRKGREIGVRVTLRHHKMYEFLERLVAASMPRIKDLNGIPTKFDGRGNYTLGVKEQIIFPEIEYEKVHQLTGMNITFITSAKTDEEAFALLTEFGLPFKKN